ncbi:MAG: hypothetical protein HY668_01345 [Chloroflexi bacterium]|nr:hypothetical protein [Chloroflexota bacterium]
MKTGEFDNILNECLERLTRGETVEQCLATYPAQAAELEPLLRTALLAKQATAIRPRPEFRNKARYEFRQAIREMKPQKASLFPGWQPRWATVVITILVLVLASGGTVAASGNSLPDEPLYPVKLAAETVRLTLTPSNMGKAQLYTELADRRVAEIVKMAEKGKEKQVERATQRLESYLQKVATLAAANRKQVTTLLAPAPQAAAPATPPAVPAPAAAPPDRTVVPAPKPAPTTRPTVVPKPTAVPSPTTATPPKTVTPRALDRADVEKARKNGGEKDKDKDKDKAEKRAIIKAIVASKAAKNSAALKALLKTAPESVKDALRRAIAVSDDNYRRALEALNHDNSP